VLSDVRPSVLVLNAGATPPMGPLHELSWENFSRAWDVDVKAGFHWVQEALRLPLPRGSRVIIASSGAALNGSPLSGSYAGALRKRFGPATRSRHSLPGNPPPSRSSATPSSGAKRPRLTRGARASASKPSSPVSARRCRRARSATMSCRSSPIRATRRASHSA
jgi:NAD(P)-dependent dehydrogenase (short-subunit alcohol dehydrogenase family)